MMLPNVKCTQLNDSYSRIDGSFDDLKIIFDFFKVKDEKKEFSTSNYSDGYERFAKVYDKALIVSNGLVELLERFGIYASKENTIFKESHITEYYETIKSKLPFELRDYQIEGFYDVIKNHRLFVRMCTGSGKSATISLVMDFLFSKGLKGILIVPNILLLEQFKSDVETYNLEVQNHIHLIGGEHKIKEFTSPITISTWQSLQKMESSKFKDIDYVLIDECHLLKGNIMREITKMCTNAKWKAGFSGSLPIPQIDKMKLIEIIGVPKNYIRASELIKYGLGSPIFINTIHLNYTKEDSKYFKRITSYPERLGFIKTHTDRTEFISKLSKAITKDQNTLVLFQHTDHGKDIFKTILQEPDLKEKFITGKTSLDYQKSKNVFFINGEISGNTREEIRNLIGDVSGAIIVANYAVLSTGVNIPKLHNMIFASPLKSYIVITQALGRGIRLHVSKDAFMVYDLVDELSYFRNSYYERVKNSYRPEGYEIKESYFNLK